MLPAGPAGNEGNDLFFGMAAFLFSSLLLKIAGIWVGLFRRSRLFHKPPFVATALPQHDTDPERPRGINQDRALYEPARLVEKLRLDSPLRLRTVRELPAKERYPIGIRIPK